MGRPKRVEVVKEVEAKIRPSILFEANELINGQRLKDYGPPKKNLQDIGMMWSAYLCGAHGITAVLDAKDVCQMMVLLKMARGFNGEPSRDSMVDQAGYTGLLEHVLDES